MEKESKNKKHPELEEGEIFLTNSSYEDYPKLIWETKRQGIIAYDINGKSVKGLFPIFVQKKEYDNGMKKV